MTDKPMTATEVEQRWADRVRVLVAKQAKWIEPMVARMDKALEQGKPDRPAPESQDIEITPEMIEAGRREFIGFDSRFDMPEDVVREIYSAMSRAKLSV